MATKAQQAEREESLAKLRALLQPGDNVYTIRRHVSASGMRRIVSVVIVKDNAPIDITWRTADVIGRKVDRDRDGIIMDGAGMDVGFEIVYDLGRALFPDGFKARIPGRNGDMSGWDKDGGYALNHHWL